MANSDDEYTGFVKFHRSITQWEWYDDPVVFKLFFHLIVTVNHKPGTWHGEEISRGSTITSYRKLASETGLSVKQVRNAILKLERAQCVAHKGHSKYSVISVLNYDKYQSKGTVMGTQKANRGHAEGKQGATNKNDKNEKNEKNIYAAAPVEIDPHHYDPPGGDF